MSFIFANCSIAFECLSSLQFPGISCDGHLVNARMGVLAYYHGLKTQSWSPSQSSLKTIMTRTASRFAVITVHHGADFYFTSKNLKNT